MYSVVATAGYWGMRKRRAQKLQDRTTNDNTTQNKVHIPKEKN